MSIFSKIFGNPERRKVEKIFKDVEQRQRPISNLAQAIGVGSISCGEALKPYLSAPTHAEKNALFAAVCYEFIYFFAHFMNRYAFEILANRSNKAPGRNSSINCNSCHFRTIRVGVWL
jgi:hypothetical protein